MKDLEWWRKLWKLESSLSYLLAYVLIFFIGFGDSPILCLLLKLVEFSLSLLGVLSD